MSNMKQILSAKELIRLEFCEGEFEELMECLNDSIEPSIISAMIEFAKMHVTEALKNVINNVKIDDYDEHGQYSPSVDENSILNAYPESNIK